MGLLGLVMFALVGSGVTKFLNADAFGRNFGNDNAAYIVGVVVIAIFYVGAYLYRPSLADGGPAPVV